MTSFSRRLRELATAQSAIIESKVGATAAVAGALGVLLWQLSLHYPPERWLMPKYLKAIFAAAVFVSSLLAAGFGVVQRLWPERPLRERLVFAQGVGMYVAYLLLLSGGLVGAYGWGFALLVPILLGGSGVLARRTWSRLWRRRRLLRLTLGVSGSRDIPLLVFGILALAGLYLGILTPKNAAFDSLWYHLGLGEGWAAEGGIWKSREGWYMAALPDFAAVLYSWAFLLPGFDLFETLMVAAHIEWFLFLGTVASIPVVVRMLVPRTRVSIAWVALFLFPCIFLYDASLHSGNDHIAACFALPAALALRAFLKSARVHYLSLLCLFASAAMMTKYQAVSIVVGPALVAAGFSVVRAVRERSFRVFCILALAGAGSMLGFTAPFWLRNFVWYGDPFYPALHSHLSLDPFTKEAASYMDVMWRVNVWRPTGTLPEQLWTSLKKAFTFSFESHAHARFHGKWPYVGSLFTLSLGWLCFVRGSKRALLLGACTLVGVTTWYFLSHVERYLQILLPWMAVVTAAALVLGFRQGPVMRVLLVALVGVQLWWGSDALFLRSHAMLGELPQLHSARLFESGFKKDYARREDVAGAWEKIGNALPQGSRILLHDENARIGLKHSVVQDKPRYTGLIAYGELASPGEVFDLYRSLGITHVVWRKNSVEYSTIEGDFRFFEFAENALLRPWNSGSVLVATMPEARPDPTPNDRALYAGCGKSYGTGLYHLSDLDLIERPENKRAPRERLPASVEDRRRLLEGVRYLAYDQKCTSGLPYPPPGFAKVATRKEEELWVRPW